MEDFGDGTVDGSGEVIGLGTKDILVEGKDELVEDGGLDKVDKLEVCNLFSVCFLRVVVGDEVWVRRCDLWCGGRGADEWLMRANALVLGSG